MRAALDLRYLEQAAKCRRASQPEEMSCEKWHVGSAIGFRGIFSYLKEF